MTIFAIIAGTLIFCCIVSATIPTPEEMEQDQ